MFWKLQEDILDQDDIGYLVDFIKTTKRFTQFTKVREFEEVWSKWQGCKYSVYVNSGSSANLILISAMKELYGWRDNDEVIVPTVTWVTNISPVMQMGLKPVFVDINPLNFSFDFDQLKERITDRTKAIFVTHLLGFPSGIEGIKKAVAERDIKILEDCCESHGAHIDGVKIGNFGVGSTFSFYWGHHMTTVEGGMICTEREDLYNLCVLKRSHGLARELPQKHHDAYRKQYPDIDFNFLFLTDGFNFRNTELHAALGITQITKLDGYIKIRNKNFSDFLRICDKYDDVLDILQPPEGMSSFSLPFIFKSKEMKRRFQAELAGNRIESRPIISGNLLNQPFLRAYKNTCKATSAELVDKNGFYIGNNQFVNSEKLDALEDIMKKFFGR
ncbi:MAG: DegT/DnrJ/EryC1/StrS aminotransferase family protein [Nitrospinae bacterium]|nr:DegT/DnrJ/EryC1/StrS aminotransferase family protein [Nitrospinota bacterium]